MHYLILKLILKMSMLLADGEHHDEPMKFKTEWDKFNLWDLKMSNNEQIVRAILWLIQQREISCLIFVWRLHRGIEIEMAWMQVNPGVCSSYVFNLKPGDNIQVSGPYGDFFIKETEAEMLYIGGGAGMAPMRSHLFHFFHT